MVRIIYINLDKDVARRESMERQLSACGLTYERLPAANGRTEDLSQEYDEAMSQSKNTQALTPGEIGCAVSHKRCHVLALEQDYTLILEDDVILPPNFAQIIDTEIARNERHARWEYLSFDYPPVGLFFLRHRYDSIVLSYHTLMRSRSLLARIAFIVLATVKYLYLAPLSLFEALREWSYRSLGIQGPVRFFRPLYFAGCYLVTRDGARKLLSLEDKIVYAADRVQNQARIKTGLTVRAFCPLIIWQDRKTYGSSILDVPSIEY